jgi:hypothetical protein
LNLATKVDPQNDIYLPYQVEKLYPHGALYLELKQMIMLIHDIQVKTVKSREVFVSDEVQIINEHKKPRYLNQKSEVEIFEKAESKGRRQVKLDPEEQPPPVYGPMTQEEQEEF